VSSAPLSENGLTGVKATFAFDDVRLLNLNNREGAATPTPQLRFELDPADAGGRTLRVRLPQGRPAPPDAPPEAPPIAQRPELPPEALAMVRNMFKGAKITVAVEVDGAIVTTDAPKRDGSRVTIFNSLYPAGLVVPGSYVYLGGSGTTDLSALVVSGQINRVVITQVDDCCSSNNLQRAEVVLNGEIVTPAFPTSWGKVKNAYR